ncbi:MAG: TrkH family potassium uptake protein [Clostridia bacterium]|nr:TrkH family potassium uptake protein [Clostridia bacterium]
MNYKLISRIFALILVLEAIFMLPAIVIAACFDPLNVTLSFLISMGITLGGAGLFALFSIKAKKGFYAKEGLVCVSLSWILMGLFGALPFFLSGAIPNYVNALFEIVSGFTTTGASILSEIESLPKSVLYWRSFSHWIGGMGVLVFLLAIVPLSGRNDGFTIHLLRAESPGPDVGKLRPRMRQTALILYATYIVLTILDFGFLAAGGLNPFDALCTAFGTAGTGGFAIHNDSLAGFTPYLQNVCSVFMFLFGVNFSCYFLLLLRHFKAVFKDEELRLYILTVVISIAIITINIRNLPGMDSIWDALRHSAFQVTSIISTTGYSTVDFNAWPALSKSILVVLMVTGACAGSTCGGMKCVRILLLFKGMKRNISKMIHPQKVQPIRSGDKVVSEEIMANTNAYLSAYVIILALSCVVISADPGNFSFTTNFTAVVACFNNVGPGLGLVGPMGNYGDFSIVSKLVLILDMLAGRLEIFPILMLIGSGFGLRKKS